MNRDVRDKSGHQKACARKRSSGFARIGTLSHLFVAFSPAVFSMRELYHKWWQDQGSSVNIEV